MIFYSSWIFFRGAWIALRSRTLDMMVLVAVAIGTGWIYSVAATFWIEGEVFYEAAALLAAFVPGPLARDAGSWGANDAIRALLDLAPSSEERQARRGADCGGRRGRPAPDPPGREGPRRRRGDRGDGRCRRVHRDRREHARAEGAGVAPGGATINRTGTLRARATAVGSDTALAQIVKLVQEAQASKAPGQRLADRAAFWLVLVALVGGLATFAVWYWAAAPPRRSRCCSRSRWWSSLPRRPRAGDADGGDGGHRARARRGILFKTAVALEALAKVQAVVFDKTGTLTRGEPAVVEVVTAPGVDRPNSCG